MTYRQAFFDEIGKIAKKRKKREGYPSTLTSALRGAGAGAGLGALGGLLSEYSIPSHRLATRMAERTGTAITHGAGGALAGAGAGALINYLLRPEKKKGKR